MWLQAIVTWTWRVFATATVVAGAYVGLSAYGLTPDGVSLPGLDGCPHGIGTLHARWPDTLTLDGRTYRRVWEDGPADHTVGSTEVGRRLGQVRCRTADQTMPGYRPRHGHARYLEPGTPVHALVDTDPALRVVAIVDGAPIVYERWAPEVSTGSG